MIFKRNLKLCFCFVCTFLTIGFIGFLLFAANKITRTGVYGYVALVFINSVSVMLSKINYKLKLVLLFAVTFMPYFGTGLSLYLWIFKDRKQSRKLKKVGLYARKPLVLRKEVTDAAYFDDAENLWNDLLLTLSNAKHEVLLFSYIFNFGKYGAKFISIIFDLLERGISVKIGVDYFGSGDIRANEQIKSLKRRGAEIFVKNKPFCLLLPKDNRRVHAKVCVIDKKIVYMESANLDDISIEKDKNCGVKLNGRLENLAETFGFLWDLNNKYSATKNNYEHLDRSDGNIYCFGLSKDNMDAKDFFTAMFFKAQKSVKIVTPYLSMDETVFNAVSMAIKRGVKITIIVPSKKPPSRRDKVTSYYAKKLMCEGALTLAYQGEFLHSKMFIFDESTVVSGSANFDARSYEYAMETILISNDNGLIEAFLKDFNKILATSLTLDLKSFGGNILLDGIMSFLSPFV